MDDDSTGSWDFDRQYERDGQREQRRHRLTRTLDARGTVRIAFVDRGEPPSPTADALDVLRRKGLL